MTQVLGWSPPEEFEGVSGKTPPTIIDGTINLSGWDFEKDDPVKLKGDWLFAWEKLVEPAPWSSLKKQFSGVSDIPERWTDHSDMRVRSKAKDSGGYGSYAVRIVSVKAADIAVGAIAGNAMRLF